MSQSCKTCKFLDVPPNKRGRIVVRDTAYRCVVPIPKMPMLPDCITKQYGYTDISVRRDRWMVPKQGETCPLYEARKP